MIDTASEGTVALTAVLQREAEVLEVLYLSVAFEPVKETLVVSGRANAQAS